MFCVAIRDGDSGENEAYWLLWSPDISRSAEVDN